MLEQIKNMFLIDKKTGKNPIHVALTMDNFNLDINKTIGIIKDLIEEQVTLKVRIMTFYLLPDSKTKSDGMIDSLMTFFNELNKTNFIEQNQIKVSILGKWYELPTRAVDLIKSTINNTKDYDNYFLNFCVNYNGREEVVDACRIIALKLKSDKIFQEEINEDLVKENLYTSYFYPVNIMIKTGKDKVLTDFLLWDSVGAKLILTNEDFTKFSKKEFNKIIKEY